MSVDAIDAQAAGEDFSSSDSVEFMGEKFALPDRVAFWSFIVFAKIAKTGVDSNDIGGMAAMFDMVHGCLSAEDSDRFDQVAVEKRAGADEIFAFVQDLTERIATRPTAPPSGSSQPERKISKKSRGRSSSPAEAAELQPVGDLALSTG